MAVAGPLVASALAAATLLPATTSALVCSCDDRYCTTPTCETDGVCFASLKREKDGSVTRGVRCVDKHYLIPPQRPFVCEYNLRNNHTYVAGCCGDTDLCNDALRLRLAEPPAVANRPAAADGSSVSDGGDSVTLVLVVSLRLRWITSGHDVIQQNEGDHKHPGKDGSR